MIKYAGEWTWRHDLVPWKSFNFFDLFPNNLLISPHGEARVPQQEKNLMKRPSSPFSKKIAWSILQQIDQHQPQLKNVLLDIWLSRRGKKVSMFAVIKPLNDVLVNIKYFCHNKIKITQRCFGHHTYDSRHRVSLLSSMQTQHLHGT